MPLRTALPRGDRDRQRLAGHRRLVDDRLVRPAPCRRPRRSRPVRTSTTSPGTSASTGDLLPGVADAAPVGDARRALEQRGQVAPRAAGRVVLERVAAREHQRDDRAGELLAGGERARHREQRDHVDADVAAQQRPRDLPGQRDQHHDDRGRPGDLRRFRFPPARAPPRPGARPAGARPAVAATGACRQAWPSRAPPASARSRDVRP